MHNTALLIIDMQVGNFAGDEPIYQGELLLANTGYLVEQARRTQQPIIFVQHCGGPGEIDEPGSPGWEIHPDLGPVSNPAIQKRTPDSFHETTLHNELQAQKIKHLIIAGLQTEYCIDTTCRRAFSLGYKVTLIEDAHGTWPGDELTAPQIITHHNRVLGDWFVSLKKAKNIQF